MLYPIWQPWPRPRFFPSDADLDRLLDRYDPRVGYLKLSMKRRHARDLRKGLFGPKGLRSVPDESGGEMEFDLPNGWTLRLTYYAAGRYNFEKRRGKAGDVDAEFIPPAMRTQRPRSKQELPRPTEQAQP